jgi:hypothetical protein
MYGADSVLGPDEQLNAPKTAKWCNIDELGRR